MKRQTLISLVAGVTGVITLIYGVRYLNGTWAPIGFDGGLVFAERPELFGADGQPVSEADLKRFVEICGQLRSTTRDIGEDPGAGFIRIRFPTTGEQDFLKIYAEKNAVFYGWWIDAKYHAMIGRRAPCFELSNDLKEFIRSRNLVLKHEASLFTPPL